MPSPHPGRRVVLLVGSGNNGGDALYAGAFLRRRGMRGHRGPARPGEGAPRPDSHALRRAGGRVLPRDDPAACDGVLGRRADVIIDGIVGLAARPPLRENAAELVG